ncbi:transcription termination factor 3, mitochondrial-like [Amphiura filiformis]|uniref:transcription termination factor 3, mitochondrial-like n=1 Tax=Amphiura filiformis TaxID=82378 RepID=UPI003B222D08
MSTKMAKIICSKMSSLHVRPLYLTTRSLLTQSPQCIMGMCNYSSSRHSHQCIISMRKLELCSEASSVILGHQRKLTLHGKSPINKLFLSGTCSSNFLTNKSLCCKNVHTSISKFNSDVEAKDQDITDREEASNVNPVIANVSPEVNEIQKPVETAQEVTVMQGSDADEFTLDAVPSESEDERDVLAKRKVPKAVEEYAEQPLMPISYTLASYVEQSEVLQKLIQLGVDLSKVEKRRGGVGEKILKMNFDPDVTEKISFLHFVGVESDSLGKFLTKNPHILLEDQENLEKRVKYLTSKKFDQTAIAQIVNRAPYILCFPVERLDNRLGFYQKTFHLTGEELRQIITACPKLATQTLEKAKENIFVLKQQFGFYMDEVKSLVVSHPRILTRGKYKLITVFDYLHNDMGIPHKLILNNPQVFNSRAHQIQERHKFLEHLGRAQYDPKETGYVSLKSMVTLPDEEFCQEIAKSTIEEYNDFLKTV